MPDDRPTIRDRAVLAACAGHTGGGCEVGERTTDAVLAEVKVWLVEHAEAHPDNVCALAIALLADELSGAQVMRDNADLVRELTVERYRHVMPPDPPRRP